MLDAVGQCFLHHPVGYGAHGRVERLHRSGQVDADVEAGGPRPPGQWLDVAEPRTGGAALTAAPKGAHEPAQVAERLTASALDGPQRSIRLLRVGSGDRPCPAGLDHHHAQAVRDHVMQLARHPAPFLARRHPGTAFLLGIDQRGTLPEVLGQQGA